MPPETEVSLRARSRPSLVAGLRRGRRPALRLKCPPLRTLPGLVPVAPHRPAAARHSNHERARLHPSQAPRAGGQPRRCALTAYAALANLPSGANYALPNLD